MEEGMPLKKLTLGAEKSNNVTDILGEGGLGGGASVPSSKKEELLSIGPEDQEKEKIPRGGGRASLPELRC